jgi:hypothetical protein
MEKRQQHRDDHIVCLTTAEIGKALGWKNRQRVSHVARREGWRSLNPNRSTPGRVSQEYFAVDVLEYVRTRQRTILFSLICEAFGEKTVKGLLREDKYDGRCPVCNGFAVAMPLSKRTKKVLAYLDLKEEDALPWACVNGHSKDNKVDIPGELTYPDLPWELLDEQPKLELPAKEAAS